LTCRLGKDVVAYDKDSAVSETSAVCLQDEFVTLTMTSKGDWSQDSLCQLIIVSAEESSLHLS